MRVVGRRHRQHVAPPDADAPLGGGRGHRHVPRHRARGLEVLRLGAEQPHRLPVAREREVGPQPARVQVAGRADEHAVLLDRQLVLARARSPRGLLRVGEAAVAAARALVDVEDGVDLPGLDVAPQRVEVPDARGGRRPRRDEVDVVGDVHLGRRRRQVVDHVVHDPVVLRLVDPAVAVRRVEDRLLLARREQRPEVRDPDGVVEVDDVHARDRPVLVREVGLEARDVPGDVRLELVALELDRVLPRRDLDRPELVVDALHAGLGARLDGRLRRRADGRGGRCGHGGEERCHGEQRHDQSGHAVHSSRRRRCPIPSRALPRRVSEARRAPQR